VDIDGYQKCRSTLWDKGGIDGRTREAQIKAGAQPEDGGEKARNAAWLTIFF